MNKKYALILGGYSDVGAATAHALAREGYQIQLAGRNLEKLETIAKDLQIRHHVDVQLIEIDVLDFKRLSACMEELEPLPEVAVQVFGYLGEQEHNMRSDEACLQVVNTNYTAAVLALNHLMLRMEKRGSGTIAGISSVAGERGRMSNFIYGSAKAGLTAYLSGLRNRGYHTGVHVITVKPGFIRTAMTAGLPLPQPLTAEPEQVASDIVRAIKRKKNVIYSLWFWKYIMWLIRNIPEGVFMRRKL